MAEAQVLIFFSLLAALSVTSVFALSGSPFILAHKKALLTKLKSGSERVSVTIDIYNRGLSTAYDISLTDDTWSLDVFDVVTGNTSKSWKTLDGGGHVSHSFELESKVKTVYYSAPALIKFRVPTKSKLLEAYSNPILALEILADEVTLNKYELLPWHFHHPTRELFVNFKKRSDFGAFWWWEMRGGVKDKDGTTSIFNWFRGSRKMGSGMVACRRR
ncbi:hypothetical protein ACH5RR_025247 [Cinchona calisaya]|uniref:Uncharacterized protein n=1 Tax=Cinchona calisaya TaxID=153742 RepID=A0ABD2Z2G9_9GENT